MKIYLFPLIFLFLISTNASADYLTQPLHSDMGLGSISIKGENEIREIFKTSEKDLNIVLNYIKTALFTEGYVSKEQDQLFKETLSKLNEEDKKKIEGALNESLLKKKLTLKIIDLTSRDYYLPITLFQNGDK